MRGRVCNPRLGSTAVLFLSMLVAAAGAGAQPSNRAGQADQDAYVLARAGRWSSTNCSLDELRRLRLRLSGDFLWFRHDGSAYVVRDATVLNRAFSLFAPLAELEPERSDLERIQRRLDERDRALDREQEDLERVADRVSGGEAGADSRRLAAQQREIEARQRALEAEQRRHEGFERALEAREDAIERRAEAELWRLIDQAVSEGVARPFRR